MEPLLPPARVLAFLDLFNAVAGTTSRRWREARPKFDFHTALDVQFDSLPPRHDIDVGDVGLIELLGVRTSEEDRVVAKRYACRETFTPGV